MDLELKNDILEIKQILSLFVPSYFTISDLVRNTGKSRQAIREYLYNHFEPDVDFFKKNDKIYVTRSTAIQIIQRNI